MASYPAGISSDEPIMRRHQTRVTGGQYDATTTPATNQGRAQPNTRHSPYTLNTFESRGRCYGNTYTQGWSVWLGVRHPILQKLWVYRRLTHGNCVYILCVRSPYTKFPGSGCQAPGLNPVFPWNTIALPVASGREILHKIVTNPSALAYK